jgi:hypothetical protein
MDIRYNFVFWVNRDERGFSIGSSYVDPRTGEILAAKPRMDSARIRTISNYWKAYKPELRAGDPTTEQSFVSLREALVTAHEIGHTLGFEHNWNSSMNDRASVMEYPSPRIKLTADNHIDLSDAFESQIGDYDKFTVRYSYTPLAGPNDKKGLDAIIDEMRAKGLMYTPESDPRWNRYDDLANPALYLRETIKQRKLLLAHYGLEVLEPGEDVGDLRGEGMWMTYLHHRWAIDSGVRYIGGQYHNYVVKGDSLPPTEIVPAALQREILAQLMIVIQPDNLAIPESLLAALTTDPYGHNIEDFNVATGYAFDHLSAARTLADMVIGQLLQPDRAARLISFADRQQSALTLPEALNVLMTNTWLAPRDQTPMQRSLRRVTQQVVLDSLVALAANAKTTPEGRAVAMEQLVQLKKRIAAQHDPDTVTEAHLRQAERDITAFLANPVLPAGRTVAPPQPAGAPLADVY